MDNDKLHEPQGSRPSPGGGGNDSRSLAEDRRRIIKLALASAPVIWTLTARSAHAIRPENARELERMRLRKHDRVKDKDDDPQGSEDADEYGKKEGDLQMNAADGPSRCSATHSPAGDCNPL